MSRLLRAVGCLNQATRPTDTLDTALFGEQHVASICESLGTALDFCPYLEICNPLTVYDAVLVLFLLEVKPATPTAASHLVQLRGVFWVYADSF